MDDLDYVWSIMKTFEKKIDKQEPLRDTETIAYCLAVIAKRLLDGVKTWPAS